MVKNGEILFFLKHGEMVKNGDLNFKIVVVQEWGVLDQSIKLLSLSVISDLGTFGNTICRKYG